MLLSIYRITIAILAIDYYANCLKLNGTNHSNVYAFSNEQALSKQNELRAEQGSSNMKKLLWSSSLASEAQALVDGCVFKHLDGGGDNIAMSAGDLDYEEAINQWYKEKNNYDYSSGSCSTGKVCGHYTQLVWAESEEVGCAKKLCTPLVNPDGNNWNSAAFVACVYNPIGNIQGVSRPYKEGVPCTECSTGIMKCSNKLCDSTCSGTGCTCETQAACRLCSNGTDQCTCQCHSGYIGINCDEPCADTHQRCNNGWYPENCDHPSLGKSIQKGCPLMCNVCDPPPIEEPKCDYGAASRIVSTYLLLWQILMTLS